MMISSEYDNSTPNDSMENLARIKQNIATSYLYFRDNYERFRRFQTYVFKESINDQQRAFLRKNVRPIVEVNILEAFISTLRGEFSEHEPSIFVSPSEGVPVDQKILDIVEDYIRHVLHEANKDSFSDDIYKDQTSGGFSVAKVYTDYSNPMSFNQEIYITKAFDATLCGFDPMARKSHKGDGKWCFEIMPFRLEDFKREFPQVETERLKYTTIQENTEIEGFMWSYKDIKENKIILVVDYYEKIYKKTEIVKLSTGHTMTKADYKKLQKLWAKEQVFEQIPKVIGKPRKTMLQTICRYRVTQNAIIEYEETDYAMLPLVFFDGNSIHLSHDKINSTYQFTRPYVYHAKGMQDLKNFSAQGAATYLNNIVQHKFIIKEEAIPQADDYLQALKNIQRADNIVVRAYSENNPDKPIPEPITPVVNPPAPPEILSVFQMTDAAIQTVLGGFASNLNKNDNDLSGKAVIELSSKGNAASKPYIMGYLAGLTQIANIIVDLIPKYWKGARTMPLKNKKGEQRYQPINSKDAPHLYYEEGAIKVNVDAGINFQVQKNQAVQQIIGLTQAMPKLAEFFNSEEGLPVLIKNLTIYGADNLIDAVGPWLQKQEQMQQQQQQMAQQAQQQQLQAMTAPQMMRAQVDSQKIQLQAQELQLGQQQQQFDNQIKIAEMAIEKELADAKLLESEAKISQAQIDSAMRMEEGQTKVEAHALDAAAKIAEIKSREHSKNTEE